METQQDHVILLLEALASPVRLNICRLLVGHEPDGLVAGDIAARLAGNGLSFHLKALQYTGLKRPSGRPLPTLPGLSAGSRGAHPYLADN